MRRFQRPRTRKPADPRRGGFTLVEIIIVAAVVGILAGLAIPNLRTMLYKARAVEMAGEMEVVRVAALSYQGVNHAWPAESASGAVPAGLDDFLPENYDFVKEGYQLDYENWALPSGLPTDPGATQLIGISVTAEDPVLGNALLELLGSAVVFSAGTTHTIVIEVS